MLTMGRFIGSGHRHCPKTLAPHSLPGAYSSILGPDQHAQIAHANTGRSSSTRFLLWHSSVADCRYSDAKWMLEVALVIFERHRATPLAEL
jgi:hypothetical protein